MSKFKVGDRVKHIKGSRWVPKNSTGTVCKENSTAPYISWDHGGENWTADENDLVLIEENEMSNENELKFGHHVITHSMERKSSYKGRFIAKDMDEFWVLHDGDNDPQRMSYCELDPDATEFLAGDVVEYKRSERSEWDAGIYDSINSKRQHFVRTGHGRVNAAYAVRYPQPEPSLKDQLDKAIEGGARCILMNPHIEFGLQLDTENKTSTYVSGYTYNDIPIAITDTVKTFEVIK